jgi:hypothetical protein
MALYLMVRTHTSRMIYGWDARATFFTLEQHLTGRARIFNSYRAHNFLRCEIKVCGKIVLALGASIKAK